MKLENTLENKAKFFAQYWGQYVLYFTSDFLRKIDNLTLDSVENDDYLELKHISQISDEESILMYRGLETHYENAKQFLEDYAALDFLSQNEADILRSKGYALPYMDLSVEDLVEYGWVKLKEN